ncbi:PstS family phosphate ABC transporter substrate-binding protein [Thiospirochaeta perfilievii]|uniref:Phosphate-binding protein n=1 Tax=Thiospirochaeta perfilievii TaxID=252967 RepID=A0A5C1QEL2_9SPIO|nr:PstS family phosphate ABC transporter substrate-binding protein [Thiospirochaeta perfilievii]QEN05086.1 PstS family phosphate ABC transporter substrate-binding protein [Thiospirochaeta perfilievii]
MKKIILLSVMFVSTLAVFASANSENSEASSSSASNSWMVESEDGILPGVNPINVKGDIITAGSSTVFPLSEAMAERFQDEGYAGNITVDSIGSGAGFERFTVTGETDISNASRPIKSKEIEAAKKIGRNPIEFRVGTDALAVTVAKSNTFIKDASIDELVKIFTAEKWSDVNPSWPDEKILKFIPGTDSGTFDYFVEEVFDKDSAPLLSAANVQMSEDDNILVQGITESPYGIGFFGYAYYSENKDILNILSIDGVEPIKENVDAAKYPLARPLFIYSDAEVMKSKPQVAAFINFYLTYVNEEVTRVGYFPADESVIAKGKAAWLEAMK